MEEIENSALSSDLTSLGAPIRKNLILLWIGFLRCFGKHYRKGAAQMPTRLDIENTIKALLARYNADYALLFGSYAGGE
jgi:hypothetical protein